MVMRAADGWKQQMIPEHAVSHWLPPPPTITLLVQLTNCHGDARLASLFPCTPWRSCFRMAKAGPMEELQGAIPAPGRERPGPARLSVALELGSVCPGLV